MVKIKLKLFESVAASIVLPNVGLVFTTLFLIISLIVEQNAIVYKCIIISYITCIFAMGISLFVCFLATSNSKEELIICNDSFIFRNQKYLIDQIVSCEYYVCKWYMLPIIYIYKQQAGGLITITLNTNEKIQFRVLYQDYLKIKNKIPNINLK